VFRRMDECDTVFSLLAAINSELKPYNFEYKKKQDKRYSLGENPVKKYISILVDRYPMSVIIKTICVLNGR
jgi:hypothetical protein